MNKKLVIANWKMNLNMQESSIFLHKLSEKIQIHRGMEIILAPSTFTLQSLSLQVNHRQFKLAAQNFYWRDHGAFTGEVAISQLRGIVQYALVGHSERRNIFHETDKDIRAKVAAAIRNDIRPILCIGETSDERNHGETALVLNDQLIGGLANVSSEDISKVIVAYEPVWAIGTGKTATSEDAQNTIKSIRNKVKELFNTDDISILYGGSVKGSNAKELFSMPDIDGGLVGGASLKADSFAEIVNFNK